MILGKKFIYNFVISLLTTFIFFTTNFTFANKYHTLQKSYFGSLLAGQIAKYNNDSLIASEFYSFASKKDPQNSNLLNLSLMSLILSGQVEEAINKINTKKQNNVNNSEIQNLLLFFSLVKKKTI